MATNLLTELMASELYPGHQTEHAEGVALYREGGRAESSILMIGTPESLIAEGIRGTWAARTVALEDEDAFAAEVLGRHGIDYDADLARAVKGVRRPSRELRQRRDHAVRGRRVRGRGGRVLQRSGTDVRTGGQGRRDSSSPTRCGARTSRPTRTATRSAGPGSTATVHGLAAAAHGAADAGGTSAGSRRPDRDHAVDSQRDEREALVASSARPRSRRSARGCRARRRRCAEPRRGRSPSIDSIPCSLSVSTTACM